MASTKTSAHKTRKISLRQKVQKEEQQYEDQLAVEEPLEIRIHDEPVTITMRTPGDDMPLAAGFLYAEGLLKSSRDIATLRHSDNPKNPELKNIVNLTFSNGHKPDLKRLRRNFVSMSSSGISGKTSLSQIHTLAGPVDSSIKVGLDVVYSLGKSLRRAQTIFEKTGGLLAAGVFTERGVLHTLHEDVGRHNAVDKAIGQMLLKDVSPLEHHILMVSGRASFEIIQKAVMARMPMVCAVSAPSSLAVETAREFGVTLVGFLREDDFNVYTHAERIAVSSS